MNTVVGTPPSVLVRDASNNPVVGVAVTFAVTAGGGAVLPATPVVTNASGVATATSWTLGTGAGTNNNTVTATAAGLSGSPVAFTASGTAGVATQIAANSVISQSDTVGLAVAVPPSVIVRDAGNNPVAGVAVTFAVTGGGGAVLPATPVATNASGIATLTSWTLGTGGGGEHGHGDGHRVDWQSGPLHGDRGGGCGDDSGLRITADRYHGGGDDHPAGDRAHP